MFVIINKTNDDDKFNVFWYLYFIIMFLIYILLLKTPYEIKVGFSFTRKLPSNMEYNIVFKGSSISYFGLWSYKANDNDTLSILYHLYFINMF